MKPRSLASIVIIGIVIVISVILLQRQDQSELIFQIGQEDEGHQEFKQDGFQDQTKYIGLVGVNCSAENFPREQDIDLDQSGSRRAYSVEQITIIFTAKKDYMEAILRLSRAGAETTIVTVDGDQSYNVTNSMLGSDENSVFGSYNLVIGELNKGTHTIELTIANDGKGNGGFYWDALSLFGHVE